MQIWSPVRANLTSVGGPANGTVIDWIIQEIDIATNKVIWEWHDARTRPDQRLVSEIHHPGSRMTTST